NWPDQLSPEIILNRPRQLASTESRQSKPRDRIRLERGAPAFGIRNQPGKCPPAATDPSRWVGGARRWTRARPGVRTSSEPRPGRENASPNRNEIATTSGTRRSDNALRLWFNSRGRTRTCDPTVNSRLLYQLSYAGPTDSKISRLLAHRQPARARFARLFRRSRFARAPSRARFRAVQHGATPRSAFGGLSSRSRVGPKRRSSAAGELQDPEEDRPRGTRAWSEATTSPLRVARRRPGPRPCNVRSGPHHPLECLEQGERFRGRPAAGGP